MFFLVFFSPIISFYLNVSVFLSHFACIIEYFLYKIGYKNKIFLFDFSLFYLMVQLYISKNIITPQND